MLMMLRRCGSFVYALGSSHLRSGGVVHVDLGHLANGIDRGKRGSIGLLMERVSDGHDAVASALVISARRSQSRVLGAILLFLLARVKTRSVSRALLPLGLKRGPHRRGSETQGLRGAGRPGRRFGRDQIRGSWVSTIGILIGKRATLPGLTGPGRRMNVGKALFAQAMAFVLWKTFGRIVDRPRFRRRGSWSRCHCAGDYAPSGGS